MTSPSTLSRREAFSLLALGSLASLDAAAIEPAVDAAIADLFALKRRAYATGDAELLRQFYADDIVVVGEGMKPLLGIDPLIAAYKVLLPRRKGIEVEILRSGRGERGDMAYQFAKVTATPVDTKEILPIVTFLFVWQRRSAGWRCIIELLLRQDLSESPGFRVATESARSLAPQEERS